MNVSVSCTSCERDAQKKVSLNLLPSTNFFGGARCKEHGEPEHPHKLLSQCRSAEDVMFVCCFIALFIVLGGNM